MIEYIAVFFSIIGSVLISLKQRVGFLSWIIANLLWIIFAVIYKHWGLVFLSIFYFITTIVGWFYWKEKK